MKNTKILCTMGPASMEKKTIKSMIANGMNACRINTSYGSFEQYDEIISSVRSFAKIPIILDTQGSEVRIASKSCSFKKGEVLEIKLSSDVYGKIRKGKRVVFNDGLNEGIIKSVNSNLLSVRMSSSGQIVSGRKIVFKGVDLKLPVLTVRDEEVLRYAAKKRAAFIALSYTKNKDDVLFVKNLLKGTGIKVIAKIECKEAVDNYKEIIRASDAVMIARGDLGVEIESEKIPLLQKRLIMECNRLGVPVIVATQMMESMINNKTPTRAETSDVANAILDGADCVMLSGETSIGKYPSLVVKKMRKICSSAENAINPVFEVTHNNVVDIITTNAFEISEVMNAKILCMTRSGYTARMISRFKPKNSVITFTNNVLVMEQLMISYAIMPIYYEKIEDYDIKEAAKMCLKSKLFSVNDFVVFVAGLFIKKTTNTITLFNVKELMG